MIRPQGQIFIHKSPGELRAVFCNANGAATHTFSQLTFKPSDRARFGTIHEARIRTFADNIRGAFCELTSGEEVFLRLKDRAGFTEGAHLIVEISSEARADKLARVSRSSVPPTSISAFDAWQNDVGASDTELIEDRARVDAVFEDSLNEQAALPGGGRLFIQRTRALTAVDVDTAGRLHKGSAAAQALSVNRDAAVEMVRQISLRRLGGNVILDCVGPNNGDANSKIRDVIRTAFDEVGLASAKVLKPSPLGLLEAAVPWRYQPIGDAYEIDPTETRLLESLRQVQREAEADPTGFYDLALCPAAWRYYLSHKSQVDAELLTFFSGRVSVNKSDTELNEVRRR
ncbi:MAG: ribonuclease E/G [Pseudomonadota bacterium]